MPTLQVNIKIPNKTIQLQKLNNIHPNQQTKINKNLHQQLLTITNNQINNTYTTNNQDKRQKNLQNQAELFHHT